MVTNIITYIKTYFRKTFKSKKTLSHLHRARKRWTEEEIDDMVFMFEQGGSASFIAKELDRPVAGVRSKLISLGYSTRKGA